MKKTTKKKKDDHPSKAQPRQALLNLEDQPERLLL